MSAGSGAATPVRGRSGAAALALAETGPSSTLSRLALALLASAVRSRPRLNAPSSSVRTHFSSSLKNRIDSSGSMASSGTRYPNGTPASVSSRPSQAAMPVGTVMSPSVLAIAAGSANMDWIACWRTARENIVMAHLRS